MLSLRSGWTLKIDSYRFYLFVIVFGKIAKGMVQLINRFLGFTERVLVLFIRFNSVVPSHLVVILLYLIR